MSAANVVDSSACPWLIVLFTLPRFFTPRRFGGKTNTSRTYRKCDIFQSDFGPTGRVALLTFPLECSVS